MKVLFLFLFLLHFLSLITYGQNQDTVDSILQVVEQTFAPEEKIKILNDASAKLKDSDLKRSFSYASQAYQLASETNDTHGMIEALLNLGRYYTRLGQHDIAMENYFKALAYSEEIKDNQSISRTYNIIGSGYYFKNDIPMALQYYKKALNVNPKSLNEERTADLQNNIALVYTDQGKLDSAGIYFTSAAAMYEKLNLPKKLANTLLNSGLVKEKMLDYEQAINYYQKALKINQALGVRLQEGFVLNQICSAFIKLNKLDEAKINGEQALAIGLAEQFHPLLINTYENLYLLSKAKRDFVRALFYHESLLSTKEKLFDKERNKQMEELRTKYESEQKEQENKDLQADASLIAKQLLLTQLLLGLSVAFTLVVSILAYNHYKALVENRKTKADLLVLNLQIEKQKEELLEQAKHLANANDEITSMNINLERLVEEKTLRILQQSERLMKYAFQNAHNVRGPLARLMGLVGLLKLKEVESAEVPFILNEIEKASAELDSVIKEINTSLEDI
jgi:tetratricopeptide (TPR) repeat protein